MIHLRALRPAALAHLAAHLARTPDAPAWVGEVESYVLDWGPAEVLRTRSGQVLLVEDDGTVVGAAIHRQSEFPGAELLAALLIDHRYRGAGRGEGALRAAVEEAHRASGRNYVIWQVHKENDAMAHLSRKVGEHDSDAGEYLVFVHER